MALSVGPCSAVTCLAKQMGHGRRGLRMPIVGSCVCVCITRPLSFIQELHLLTILFLCLSYPLPSHPLLLPPSFTSSFSPTPLPSPPLPSTGKLKASAPPPPLSSPPFLRQWEKALRWGLNAPFKQGALRHFLGATESSLHHHQRGAQRHHQRH